ncbi:MAG: Smr/MutS family protein [Treponema sp.]|jgi:DNA-nicking Smr family endonuclease|nr:Smr/MutS family protein [Treponema sp.]
MDFGSILDQWDKETARPQRKQAGKLHRSSAGNITEGRASVCENERADHPLSAWLRINGVYDKDADAGIRAAGRGERRRRLMAKKPDAVIDLHGLTQDEAWKELEDFFHTGIEMDFEKVLIIHGKGNHSDGEGVLRNLCRKFIEHCPFAGESGYGASSTGGKGATWVLLKRGV